MPLHGGTLVEGEVGSSTPRIRFLPSAMPTATSRRSPMPALWDSRALGNLVPVLASGYNISADGKTYTFHVASGRKLSDGTSVTAQDVVFTVSRRGLRARVPEYADRLGLTVEAIDQHTVRLTLAEGLCAVPRADNARNFSVASLAEYLHEQFSFSTRLKQTRLRLSVQKAASVSRDFSGLIESVSFTEKYRSMCLVVEYLDHTLFCFLFKQ